MITRSQRLGYRLMLSAHSQERIDHGVLLRWTKGFGAPNIEGRDVAAMFKQSLEKFVSRLELQWPRSLS